MTIPSNALDISDTLIACMAQVDSREFVQHMLAFGALILDENNPTPAKPLCVIVDQEGDRIAAWLTTASEFTCLLKSCPASLLDYIQDIERLEQGRALIGGTGVILAVPNEGNHVGLLFGAPDTKVTVAREKLVAAGLSNTLVLSRALTSSGGDA